MKLPEELIIGIEKWGIQELWSMTKVIEDEISDRNYEKIKNGTKIKFNINKYLKDLYTPKHKSGYVIMDGKEITLENLWDEIEEREKIMRQQLIKNMERTRTIQPIQNV